MFFCTISEIEYPSDDDLLQHLSVQLDIPLLLNEDGRDTTFNTVENDILSEVL